MEYLCLCTLLSDWFKTFEQVRFQKTVSPCMNDGFRIVHLPAAFRYCIWLRFSTLVILAIFKKYFRDSGMIYVERTLSEWL